MVSRQGTNLWKLAVWYLSQPVPPFSIEVFVHIFEALRNKTKPYRAPQSWSVTPADVTGNTANFLRHVQANILGHTVDDMWWVFCVPFVTTCPKCKKDFDGVWYGDEDIKCPHCYEWLTGKKLKLPKPVMPPEDHEN